MANTPREWYVSTDGENRHGPLTDQDLKQAIRQGKITKDTLVWTQQLPDWRAAGTIKGLIPKEEAAPATRTAVPVKNETAVASLPPIPQPYKLNPGQPLGTAEWDAPESVARYYAYRHGTFWLGRAATRELDAAGYVDDRHICLVAGSRSGKGTTTIINNLCLWPGSVVVVDPKGENATITAPARGGGSEYCEGMGQEVFVLDPFSTAKVDAQYRKSFNPLDTLDPNDEDVIDEAAAIAAALVVGENTQDPFWENAARRLLHGIILYVLVSPRHKNRRNMLTVRKLILQGEWELVEIAEKQKKEGKRKDVPSGHDLLWRVMKETKAFGGVVSGIGGRMQSQSKGASKQFEGIFEHLNVNTAFLDSPGMRRCLEKSDFELSSLKSSTKGVSLYLSIPQRHMKEHFRWLRMMVTLIANAMEKTPGQPATGHRVLMCLDEFAGLKRMESIEAAVAQIAGFGVKLFFVLQSLEQLKYVYQENWETFLSNAGLKVFFGIEDHFTREYVSKLVGETEVSREVRTQNESRGTNRTETDSTAASHAEGTFSSTSENRSRGQQRNKGKSRVLNLGLGRNKGKNREDVGMFEQETGRPTISGGANMGIGMAFGGQWGSGVTNARGTGSAQGTNTTDTTTTTHSLATGSNESYGTGLNETLHRRALIWPDEIGRLFGRIDAPEHPSYPGYALVLVAGRNPFPVRRVNYFEDPVFRRRFHPHPDYPYVEPPTEEEMALRVPSQPPKDLQFIQSPPLEDLSYLLHTQTAWGKTCRVTVDGEPLTTQHVGRKVRQGDVSIQLNHDAMLHKGLHKGNSMPPIKNSYSGVIYYANDELDQIEYGNHDEESEAYSAGELVLAGQAILGIEIDPSVYESGGSDLDVNEQGLPFCNREWVEFCESINRYRKRAFWVPFAVTGGLAVGSFLLAPTFGWAFLGVLLGGGGAYVWYNAMRDSPELRDPVCPYGVKDWESFEDNPFDTPSYIGEEKRLTRLAEIEQERMQLIERS
ncbi:type IV secretory system conjugative DNA transfer family protein [Aeoliella sp.]|uniref:type IV secretory system conjugative DNA transfer family protein n=1 Tax=Aeoliella sp. TaxID=2795800 RepID=UPI003CCB9EA6